MYKAASMRIRSEDQEGLIIPQERHMWQRLDGYKRCSTSTSQKAENKKTRRVTFRDY